MGIEQERKEPAVNRIRTGLIGLVVLSLGALATGPAGAAAAGRGTASASITLLDVALGNVQRIKVLADEAQGTLDAAKIGVAANRSYGQLTAVDASGIINQVLPNPPQRAEAPGSQSSLVNPVSFSLPTGSMSVAGKSVGAGLLANGVIDPVSIKAFFDNAGARSVVGTSIPSLDVLQGLISVKDVNIASVKTDASTSSSNADSGVVKVGEVNVLDLSALLGGLGVSLPSLGLDALTGLVQGLGLPVPAGALGNLAPADAKTALNNAFSVLDTVQSTMNSLTAGVANCGAFSTITGPLGGLTSVLGLLNLGGIAVPDCASLGVAGATSTLMGTLNTTFGTLKGTAQGLTDGILGVLENAPLLKVSGIELSALANAAETVENSSASTSAKLGTIQVGNLPIGALDLNATVEQVNGLKSMISSQLGSVLGALNPMLGNLIVVEPLVRTASVKSEGGYTMASAGIDVLRVSIDLSRLTAPLGDVLSAAKALPLAGELAGAGLPVPVSTGLADGTLAQAFSLASVLSQPTTIVVGSIQSRGDFTTGIAPAGIPDAGPVDGTLPRTGVNQAWLAAFAALALMAAFGLTRVLRPNNLDA
jgi:hypothetical protein